MMGSRDQVVNTDRPRTFSLSRTPFCIEILPCYAIAMNKLINTLLFISSFSSFAARAEITCDRIETPFIVRTQGGTSLCWLHSGMQMMEQMAGEPLSIDALLIPEIRSRAVDRFLNYDTPWDGGAGPTRPFALALLDGLVPESIWKSQKSVVSNYRSIFSDIERLLREFGPQTNSERMSEFLAKLDAVLLNYIGTFPPEEFVWKGNTVSAIQLARELIRPGASMGYDFRNIQFSDSIYGRMAEIPWTTVADKKGNLKKVTDFIPKIVVRMDPAAAFKKAVEIFEQKRPVAFTFIYMDKSGRKVLSMNAQREYIAILPAVTDEYTGSHLVLVTGVLRDENRNPVGFTVLDSLTDRENIVTYDFFATHGKTVHEVSPNCESFAKL